MKLNNNYLLFLLSLLPLGSCSDKDDTASGQEPVPVVLHVEGEGLTAGTKAAETTIVPFGTTVFATTRNGMYTSLSGKYEWQKNATVGTDKKVSLADAYYPETGDWMYLVAVSPEVGTTVQDGTASYQLTGLNDLLYAPQIKGNKWDGDRFSGNTLTGSKDTPLSYSHLLTRLVFKAVKKEADGPTVHIKSISVKGVKNVVTFPLSSGEASYSGSALLKLDLTTGATAPDGISVSGKDPVSIGYLLLPPLDTKGTNGVADSPYLITVETSVGTFTDIPLVFKGSADSLFQRGMSHEITLTIGDSELEISSIHVAEWQAIPQDGELDLVE